MPSSINISFSSEVGTTSLNKALVFLPQKDHLTILKTLTLKLNLFKHLARRHKMRCKIYLLYEIKQSTGCLKQTFA